MLFYCDLCERVLRYLSSPIQVNRIWSFMTEITGQVQSPFGTTPKLILLLISFLD